MFGRGFKIFTLFGIPVYLDISFFIIVPLFAWILASNIELYGQMVMLHEETQQIFGIERPAPVEADRAATQAPRMQRPGLALTFGVLVTLGLYLSVLIHEFGHALTARLYHVPTERVTLWFLGGIASFERMPRQPGAEAVVAIAGPITSFIVGGVFLAIALVGDRDWFLWQLSFRSLFVVNIFLAVFNMLPALPLDGGRVLRSLLALAMPYIRATEISAVVSKTIAVLLALSVFFAGGNLMLVVIAVFIWLAVNAETRQSAVEDLLRGVRVGDMMVRNVETVPSDIPAGRLLEEMIRRRHLGFPVVDAEDRVVGVIGLRDLQEGFDPNQPISSLMRTDFCRADPYAPAQKAFDEMSGKDFARCLVLDPDGRLHGMLTKSDLIRLIQIRAAAMTAASRRIPQMEEAAMLPGR